VVDASGITAGAVVPYACCREQVCAGHGSDVLRLSRRTAARKAWAPEARDLRNRGIGGGQVQKSDIYGGQDPREMPAYSIPEAAHYLQMPPSTLRWWVKGWTYRTDAGERFSPPLLRLPTCPAPGPLLLSFVNVVEAHVLDALRRGHR